MKLTDLIRHLQSHGCVLVRDRGKHSVYCNASRDRFLGIVKSTPSRLEIFAAIWAFRSRSSDELVDHRFVRRSRIIAANPAEG